MTTREQLIEKAAHDLWDRDERAYWDSERDMRPMDPSADDEDLADCSREWLKTVSDVVDAILPQVRTVEEWEALPVGTVLVDSDGLPYVKDHTPSSDILISWLTKPLTVVWQP